MPTVDNRTRVLILQDRQEYFHPFNTARIARDGLKNVQLISARRQEFSRSDIEISDDAALLYPSGNSLPLDSIAAENRPGQLVVIDGTWHQAKQLLREVPVLKKLPAYHLTPDQPGEYRIRREPSETTLSTIEATVAALKILEPGTVGLDRLLQVFRRMIACQVQHPKDENGWRRNRRRTGIPFNIPVALVDDFENVVVAYGESAGGERSSGNDRSCSPRKPVIWLAKRLGDGQMYRAAIKHPGLQMTESVLKHLQLDQQEFANALDVAAFQKSWLEFLQPGDHLVVYNWSTFQLLEQVVAVDRRPLVLKSVDIDNLKNGSLDNLLARLDIAAPPRCGPGRAGIRLAKAIGLATFLRGLGRKTMSPRIG